MATPGVTYDLFRKVLHEAALNYVAAPDLGYARLAFLVHDTQMSVFRIKWLNLTLVMRDCPYCVWHMHTN